jgi:hypothetical protein
MTEEGWTLSGGYLRTSEIVAPVRVGTHSAEWEILPQSVRADNKRVGGQTECVLRISELLRYPICRYCLVASYRSLCLHDPLQEGKNSLCVILFRGE